MTECAVEVDSGVHQTGKNVRPYEVNDRKRSFFCAVMTAALELQTRNAHSVTGAARQAAGGGENRFFAGNEVPLRGFAQEWTKGARQGGRFP